MSKLRKRGKKQPQRKNKQRYQGENEEEERMRTKHVKTDEEPYMEENIIQGKEKSPKVF